MGLTETINACGGLVRPGFGLADANEAGTHPGAVRSARGAEGISVIHSGEDVKDGDSKNPVSGLPSEQAVQTDLAGR